jgi:hypothetical protein
MDDDIQIHLSIHHDQYYEYLPILSQIFLYIQIKSVWSANVFNINLQEKIFLMVFHIYYFYRFLVFNSAIALVFHLFFLFLIIPKSHEINLQIISRNNEEVRKTKLLKMQYIGENAVTGP